MTITCADFFSAQGSPDVPIDFVVGNPPWATAAAVSPAAEWARITHLNLPRRQLAAAFVMRAPELLRDGGKVCFVLPHGLLFHHNPESLEFQKRWFRERRIELVLNLADFQRFLFEDAEVPALVVRYTKDRPADATSRTEYLAPKTDWSVTRTDAITVLPQDRTKLSLRHILDSLDEPDAPYIWKKYFWSTPRDHRLVERLRLMPSLGNIVGKKRRWQIAQGYEERDELTGGKSFDLPSGPQFEAKGSKLRLFLLPDDCQVMPSRQINLRDKSNTNREVYQPPHVLVTNSFDRSAFCDFYATFRHTVRGIRGPQEDRSLLAFLAAYMQSKLARYFLFQTSTAWGVGREKVHVHELLKLPFPLPEETGDVERAKTIVANVAKMVFDAATSADAQPIGRDAIVHRAIKEAEPLLNEYFQLNSTEEVIVSDCVSIIEPSVRPARNRGRVPTIEQSSPAERSLYLKWLTESLNQWARAEAMVYGQEVSDASLGLGLVILRKGARGGATPASPAPDRAILATLSRVQEVVADHRGSTALGRGLKVFDGTSLYITKPIGKRFWSRTSALNDADEIAGSILMRTLEGDRR